MMVWNRLRRRSSVLLGVTMAVATVVLAPPALGDPATDAAVEGEAVTTPTGTFDNLVPQCPAGQRAVGGGVGMDATPVNNGNGSYILGNAPFKPLESGRLRDGDVAKRWSGFFDQSTGADQNTRVFAICSQLSDARVEVATMRKPGGSKSFKVSCPRGTRAVGGGWSAIGNLNNRESVSGPVDKSGKTAKTKTGDVARGWRVMLFGNPQKVRIYAICSADSRAKVAASDLLMPAASAMELAVSCTGDERVTGGGVGVLGQTPDGFDFPPPITTMKSVPLDETLTTAGTLDGDEPVAWLASMLNYEAERTYRVYAICEPPAA